MRWSTSSRNPQSACWAEPRSGHAEAHGERIHGVADVDGDGNAGAPMHGRDAAPGIASVLDVVVNQKCVVQHFQARRGIQRLFSAPAKRARGRRPPSARAVAMHKAGRRPFPDRATKSSTSA